MTNLEAAALLLSSNEDFVLAPEETRTILRATDCYAADEARALFASAELDENVRMELIESLRVLAVFTRTGAALPCLAESADALADRLEAAPNCYDPFCEDCGREAPSYLLEPR